MARNDGEICDTPTLPDKETIEDLFLEITNQLLEKQQKVATDDKLIASASFKFDTAMQASMGKLHSALISRCNYIL
eukprot:9396858-Ditylum_brightwellii.AAC.1